MKDKDDLVGSATIPSKSVEPTTTSMPTMKMLTAHWTPVISRSKYSISKRQRIGSMRFGTGDQNDGTCPHRMPTRLLHYTHKQPKDSASQSPITTLTREGADDIHRTYTQFRYKPPTGNKESADRFIHENDVLRSIVKNEVLRVQPVAGTPERVRKGRQKRAKRVPGLNRCLRTSWRGSESLEQEPKTGVSRSSRCPSRASPKYT